MTIWIVIAILGVLFIFATYRSIRDSHREPARQPRHAAPKPVRERRLGSVHRLGGVIGSLVERDPGPETPVPATLLEDAPSETPPVEPEPQEDPREPVFIPVADEGRADWDRPGDLDEQLAAIKPPKPGEDLGPFFERVARATGTRTGLERTAGWVPEDVTEIAAAVKEDPTLAAAVRAAEEFYAELDANAEQSMQRFEDAHRDEIEAAGDTTEQDRRSYYEGAGH